MNLKHTLQLRFPHIPPERLPGGFDRVGDIAVIGITPEVEPRQREIGEIILGLHRTLRVAARRDGEYGGEYRTLPLRVIAGEQRLTTVHRENGIVLHLDLAQVYFSTRSAHERARIAALAAPGERVAVLCSGVGPFPLIIGRHSRAREVIGIEKNPAAHSWALRNIQANRAVKTVRFLEGDVAEILPRLQPGFDRVLVVLPYGGEALLPCALDALRPGGVLHFYDMQAKDNHDGATARLAAACRERGLRMQPVRTVVCGRCGPAVHRVCLDAVIGAAGQGRAHPVAPSV
jgi:tRNA (guanine37-N1)-methyltransferase